MNGLIWFRNDLRTIDNHSLYNACRENEKVIGIYCLDPRHYETTKFGFKKTEKFRAQFLIETVAELKENLLKKNISLLIYFDTPENVFDKAIQEFHISNVYFQKEWTSEEIKVNKNLKNRFKNVNFIESFDQFLFHPEDIPYQNIKDLPQDFTVIRKE